MAAPVASPGTLSASAVGAAGYSTLTPSLTADVSRVRTSAGFWASSLRRLMRNKVSLAALIGLAVMCGIAFAAPLVERTVGLQRDKIDLLQNYQAPGAAHWFGTDEYGRDYFIRLRYGGQISILMGLAVAAITLVIAVPLG